MELTRRWKGSGKRTWTGEPVWHTAERAWQKSACGLEPAQQCGDGAEFARQKLGFEPDEKQASLLTGEHHRLLLNCTRQWGKSTVTAAKAVHRAWSRPGSLTLVLSPSERQSRLFVRKAAGFVRRLGERPRGDGDNPISLLFANGSRIVGVPGKESTIRGFEAVSLLIVDEAARVGGEEYSAVQPMLATVDGDLWLLSTPWGRTGFFWRAWVHGGEEWTRVSVKATECPRISEKFLEWQRREMGEAEFRREYLCEFMDTDNSVFDREMLMAAVSGEVKRLWG